MAFIKDIKKIKNNERKISGEDKVNKKGVKTSRNRSMNYNRGKLKM